MGSAVELEQDSPSSSLQSVILTVRVLRELAAADGPIGVSELSRRMKEQKPRVHRHLITLRSTGLVAQDAETELYRLGWGLVELGQAALKQHDIIGIADAAMRRLRDEIGMTVALGLPSGAGLVVGHTAESESMVSVTVKMGLAIPLSGSSAGRLLLAYGAASEDKKPRRREAGSDDVFSPSEEYLEAARRRRYDYSVGENRLGINSLAVPVLDSACKLVAAVIAVGTQTQIVDPPDQRAVVAIQRCAAAICRGIGSTAYNEFPIQ
jgi:DNA-binding IclR family transcriptional regulator